MNQIPAFHCDHSVLLKSLRPISSGEYLKKVRKLRKMTQMHLSEVTGLEQSEISRMEAGQKKIRQERAIRLAKALNVHPALILFPEIKKVELNDTQQNNPSILQEKDNKLLCNGSSYF